MNRRNFVRQSVLTASAITLTNSLPGMSMNATGIELSLAEWSLNRTIREGKLDHLDFAAKAKKDFGISVVEYVNGLFGNSTMSFKDAGKSSSYLGELLKRSKDAGVINHLIMVDEEGPLALPDDKVRLQAIEDHKKWFDAAQFLECKTVRVNLHGDGESAAKKIASIDSLGRLGEFASTLGLNVVVENHGSDSSNGQWVADVMKQVNRKNVGTLPDFGNFCITHPWGETQSDCQNMYDRYKGVQELLPFAKGVSAKSYDFAANGEQPKIDYKKLLDIVKASGFKGYIGIEFEGNTQPEEDGIRKTKALVERYL